MNKIISVLLFLGLILSGLFGIWHFFIPYMFQWYSYIPDAPRAIIVSIDWINFFFSLLLTGISVLLIIFNKKLKEGDTVAVAFYALIAFTWFSRVMITLLHPWNIPHQLMDWIQIGVFAMVFIMLLVPMVFIFVQKIRAKNV